MSRAPAARNKGDDYQARFFWSRAGAALLSPKSQIAKVGFDVPGVSFFDDVTIDRTRPKQDGHGRNVTRELFQVKSHVDYNGELTASTLTDPSSIGGKRHSLLQRLRDAVNDLGDAAEETTLFFVSTHSIKPGDPLSKLVCQSSWVIKLRQLREAGPKSEIGKLRTQWREHLALETSEELFKILEPLCIRAAEPSYHRLQEDLDVLFPAAGLRPVSGDGALSPYDNLIWNLHKREHYSFDAESLRRECELAKLTLPPASTPPDDPRPLVGILSFRRRDQDLEDSADDALSLLRHFDGRFLQANQTWADVHDRLTPFLDESIHRHGAFDLQIDVHSSLAFACGAICDTKRSLDLRIVQHAPRSGKEYWSTQPSLPLPDAEIKIEATEIGPGNDVILALGLTRPIGQDVRHFADDVGIPAGRMITAEPAGGSSQGAILDGAHAIAAADEIGRAVDGRSRDEKSSTLHVFAAAPNALVFFLGQISRSFGNTVLYEYDFEGSGGYQPSFQLPDPISTLS